MGETANFDFAVCSTNNNPKYYVGKDKSNGKGIIVSWNGSDFRNGNTVYVPPNYQNTNNKDAYLQVYQGQQELVNEKVIRLLIANR
ncbi:MAG: hypothetical protein NVS2B14_04140 [Chamaesiphon sp.]